MNNNETMNNIDQTIDLINKYNQENGKVCEGKDKISEEKNNISDLYNLKFFNFISRATLIIYFIYFNILLLFKRVDICNDGKIISKIIIFNDTLLRRDYGVLKIIFGLLIENIVLFIVLLIIYFILNYIVDSIYCFFTKDISKIKQEKYEQQIKTHERQVKTHSDNCITVLEKINSITIVPEDYRNIEILNIFKKYLVNQRVHTIGECINLYHYEVNNNILHNKLDQINYNMEQLKYQNQQINEELEKIHNDNLFKY